MALHSPGGRDLLVPQAFAASDQATARGNLGLQTLTNRRRWGALGDSITADALNLTTGQYESGWGWLGWTRRYLGGRIDMPASRVYAVAGASIANVVSSQLPAALANTLDGAFVHAGTNSIGSDTTANLTTAPNGLKTIYDKLLQKGVFVVAIPIRVHGASAAFTGDNLLQFNAINRWIADYCRITTGMLCVDWNSAYLDYATGNAKAGLLRDDLHDAVVGAMLGGKVVADALSPFIPQVDDHLMHVGDVFDVTKNPRGNLNATGLFAGTGGSTFSGASGSVATGWRLFGTSGGASVVGSKDTDPAYPTLARQVVTIGGTSNGGYTSLFASDLDISAILAVGDKVVLEVDIDWTITTGAITCLQLWAQQFDAAYASLGTAADGTVNNVNGSMPTGTGSITLRTDPLTIAAARKWLNSEVRIGHASSGAVAGVFNVKRFAIRKV